MTRLNTVFLVTLVSLKSGFMKLSNSFTDKNNPLQREINLLLNHFFLSVFEKSFHRFNILTFCLNIWNSISSNFMSITDSPPLHKNDCLPISASEVWLQLSRVILSGKKVSPNCVSGQPDHGPGMHFFWGLASIVPGFPQVQYVISH